MLCADPLVRKARKGSRNARPQHVIKGSQQQLADAVSTLSLTGLWWADGSKAIYDTAKAVVGTERRKARYWVYDNVGEVDRIITVRMKKAAGNTKEACDKARRDFAVLKDAWWNDCVSRLQRAAENGDTKVVHQLHREVCGPTQRKAITLPMPGGGTSKTAKETAEAFEMHFGKVLNQDRNVDPNFILSRLPQRSVHEALDNSISREEVDEAVRLLKNSKVTGEDGMPNEIWKIGALTDYLVEVCNHALEGEAPKEWVDYTITQIYKKGSPNDPDNYRGIALLSTGSKVFSAVLTRRLQRVLVPDVVPESQYGYRPGRSTEDLIHVLRQLFEKAWEKNTAMYAIFIDFRKAFDSVDRGLLVGKYSPILERRQSVSLHLGTCTSIWRDRLPIVESSPQSSPSTPE